MNVLRCKCTTLKGERCKRDGIYKGYCYQHIDKCSKIYKSKSLNKSRSPVKSPSIKISSSKLPQNKQSIPLKQIDFYSPRKKLIKKVDFHDKLSNTRTR